MSTSMPLAAQLLGRRRADRRNDHAAQRLAHGSLERPCRSATCSRCTTCVAVVKSATSTARRRRARARRLRAASRSSGSAQLIDGHARSPAPRAPRARPAGRRSTSPYSCTATRQPAQGSSRAPRRRSPPAARARCSARRRPPRRDLQLAQHGQRLGPADRDAGPPERLRRRPLACRDAIDDVEQRARADTGQQDDEVELAAQRGRRRTRARPRWTRAAPRASTARPRLGRRAW